MSSILPLVQTAQLVTSTGLYTTQFKTFLDSLTQRVGGTTGGTYTQLPVSSGSFLWDLSAAPIAVVQLTNGVNNLSIVNQVAGFFYPYRLTVVQPSTGASGTVNWPRPPVKFSGGVAPTLSTANNAVDQFWFASDGTNMYMMVEGINFS